MPTMPPTSPPVSPSAPPPSRVTKRSASGGKPLHTIVAAMPIALGFLVGAVGVPKVLAARGPEGRPFRAEDPIALPRQSFDVAHEQRGTGADDGGFFSAHIDAAPTVSYNRDERLSDDYRGETISVHLQGDVNAVGVVERDPAGLAKVAWLEDLQPLPSYAYQTITKATFSFDNGASVEASRETSYRAVAAVPPGANRLTKVVLTFDWLDQGRDLVFELPARP